MNINIFKIAIISLASDFLIAGSCANGFCGVSVPHIPTEMQNNPQLKPFNVSNKETTNRTYNIWGLVDNAGDAVTGKNRMMSGVDVHSLFDTNDKLSLFGLLSSENLTSGKLSYAYILPWHKLVVEGSYINSNYSLGEPIPGATGIGRTQTIEGKITYPFINSKEEKLNFSLSFGNNKIKEKIDDAFTVSRNRRKSYSATALIDFETKNYPLFNRDTVYKLSLGITSGKLSFNNNIDKQIDKLGAKTQGSYTKINVDYKNTISFSPNISLESNFKSQYALNNKNLGDSESFNIGGINGVKIYEQGSAYDSNGFLINIEEKYKLAEIYGIKNSLGAFYEYGKVWESDSLTSNESIVIKDAGIGIYTRYKKFFSKIQVAFKLGDSTISTKDDEDYKALFQAGIVF